MLIALQKMQMSEGLKTKQMRQNFISKVHYFVLNFHDSSKKKTKKNLQVKSPDEAKINTSMRTLDVQLIQTVIKGRLAVRSLNFLPI